MRKPIIVLTLVGLGGVAALWQLLQTPGSLEAAFSHPFQVLLGTQKQLNSSLIDVSEDAGPVRAAGWRLLQPLGVLRVDRIYNAPEGERSKKN